MDEPIAPTRPPRPGPASVDQGGSAGDRPGVDEVSRDVGALARDARRLAQLYTDLLRARVRRIVIGVTLALGAGIFALVLLVISAVYVARGTMLGFTALFGSTWAGQLLAGLLFVGLMVGGLLVRDRVQRARRLKTLHARYGSARPSQNAAAPANGVDVDGRS